MAGDSKTHHHILPIRVYLIVGSALLLLTFVTVWIAQFHFGSLNLIVAMLVAVIKASLVVLFFMHLLYDKKIFLSVFLLSILMLGVFITLTMLDTMRRGEVDRITADPIRKQAEMYDNRPAPDSSGHAAPAPSGGH